MQSLETFISEFKNASSQGDWDAIAAMQADLKDVVEAASKTLTTEEERLAFLDGIKALSVLVQSATENAASARHQVADQLRQFSRSQAAVSKYTDQSRG